MSLSHLRAIFLNLFTFPHFQLDFLNHPGRSVYMKNIALPLSLSRFEQAGFRLTGTGQQRPSFL